MFCAPSYFFRLILSTIKNTRFLTFYILRELRLLIVESSISKNSSVLEQTTKRPTAKGWSQVQTDQPPVRRPSQTDQRHHSERSDVPVKQTSVTTARGQTSQSNRPAAHQPAVSERAAAFGVGAGAKWQTVVAI